MIVCVQHYSTAGTDDVAADQLDITFTATAAADGTLLLGSSRDISWDQAAPDASTVAAMLARAQNFLPALTSVEPAAVRVGLRPQVPGVSQPCIAARSCLKLLYSALQPLCTYSHDIGVSVTSNPHYQYSVGPDDEPCS